MKWKVLFGLLFVLSITMTLVFTNKSLITYNKSSIEKVPASSGTSFSEEQITRTYEDNYASLGGAIAFGIIAAASLLAFAITVKKEKS